MTAVTSDQIVALRKMGRFIILYGTTGRDEIDQFQTDPDRNEFTHLGKKFIVDTFARFGWRGTITVSTAEWKIGLWFAMQEKRTITAFDGQKIHDVIPVENQPMMHTVYDCLNTRNRIVGSNVLAFWLLTFGRLLPKQTTFEGSRAKFEADMIILRATGQMFGPMKAIP